MLGVWTSFKCVLQHNLSGPFLGHLTLSSPSSFFTIPLSWSLDSHCCIYFLEKKYSIFLPILDSNHCLCYSKKCPPGHSLWTSLEGIFRWRMCSLPSLMNQFRPWILGHWLHPYAPSKCSFPPLHTSPSIPLTHLCSRYDYCRATTAPQTDLQFHETAGGKNLRFSCRSRQTSSKV